MFQRLRQAVRKFLGKSVVSEEDVKALIKELQRVLIAGDVDIKLVLEISKAVEKQLMEEESKTFTLKQRVIKILHDELVKRFGESYEPKVGKQKIMLVGLYGSGKTTTAGKLALFYKKKGLSIALTSLDTERPAAQEQLKQLADEVEVHFYPYKEGEPLDYIDKLKEDVVILDTAGKNALDEELQNLLNEQYNETKPDVVYLVISADIGKVAIKQAEAFNNTVPITAAIITKFEGSGKAGGALSALARLNIPIAFVGVGEKLSALETFDARSFVAKLLGLPDVKGLLEKMKKAEIEPEEMDELNLETFYKQLKAAKGMGSLNDILSSAGMYDMPKDILRQGEEKLALFEAAINSMTPYERKHPEIVKKSSSRIKRIAKGAGIKPEDVNMLLSQFFKMEKLMKRFQKDKGMLKRLKKMMPGMKGLFR